MEVHYHDRKGIRVSMNYFKNLLGNEEVPSNLKIEESRQWYREKAFEVDRLNSSNVIRRSGKLQTDIQRHGHFYLFRYDPKTKDTLPYYDRFPVVLILKRERTGFTGLNLHYLPYAYRAVLMDQLYELQTGEDELARIRVTYNILSSTSRFRFFKPCFKHYLNNHMQSRLVHIDVSEWDIGLFLPLQRFAKKNEQTVHRDSIRKIRNRQ